MDSGTLRKFAILRDPYQLPRNAAEMYHNRSFSSIISGGMLRKFTIICDDPRQLNPVERRGNLPQLGPKI